MEQTERIIQPSVLTGRSVSLLVDDLVCELEKFIGGRDAHIHRIRVDIKKLRSWIRLIEGSSCTLDLKKSDQYLKNTAKIFSQHRDAEIIQETINWLKKKTHNPETGEDLNVISRNIKYVEISPAFSGKKSSIINRKFFSGLKRESVKVDIAHAVEQGLKRTYKKGRKTGKKAFSSTGTLEDLHRFRKWAKYLCYQIEFIQASHPQYYKSEHKLLDRLGKQLGRIHDLDILDQRIRQMRYDNDIYTEVGNINRLIKNHMDKLHKHAKTLFGKIFDHSPDEFPDIRTN